MQSLSALMLVICCYTDLKERGINRKVLAAFLFLAMSLMVNAYFFGERIGVLNKCLFYEIRAENIVFALIPGAILLIICFFSKEAIGRGDVYVVALLGLMVGFERVFAMLFISMLACAVFGIMYMIIKGKGRKETLPYIPFLCLAYVICSVINVSGVG